MSPALAVVIPSIGRPSLQVLLDSLAAQPAVPGWWPPDGGVLVVDDRADPRPVLRPVVEAPWQPVVLTSGGRGPAAARNAGWRAAAVLGGSGSGSGETVSGETVSGETVGWVAFLDDDVVAPTGWSTALAADLAACGPTVAATQGRIVVPLPTDRAPTDWERNTAALQDARWATADMAYRAAALAAVGGFDERFPRAYREDADLAVRVTRAGWGLSTGSRHVRHPVRPAADLVSLRVQRGNADDALLRALYGRRWREVAATGPGRDGWHVATVLAGAVGVAGLLGHRRSAYLGAAGLVGAAGWAALTADFARRRLAPGPRPGTRAYAAELRRMVPTSIAIPPAALWHRARGAWRWRAGVTPWSPVSAAVGAARPPLAAVLFDRDGTLVHDVPYNGDPALVRLVPGAARAVGRVRAAGLRTGIVTNQSGIGRGLLTLAAVDAVNARVVEGVGGVDTVQICPHTPEEHCECRKPAPGMVLAAARELGIDPRSCAVIGDIGADVAAAAAAGGIGVLVPTAATRPAEVASAALVAADLDAALDLLGVPAVSAPVSGAVAPVSGAVAAARDVAVQDVAVRP